MENACYLSLRYLLSSLFLSKNINIKVKKINILSIVLYGCETWSVTVRVEYRLRMFENGVLRRIFGHKRVGGRGGRLEKTA
jgi:hypothetical protein